MPERLFDQDMTAGANRLDRRRNMEGRGISHDDHVRLLGQRTL
jgi:hypothetical protein